MAYINKDVSTMAMPSGMNRMGQFPLDMSSVFYNEAELRTYATSGAIAYVGQIVSLVDETNKKVTVYSIQNTDGLLKEVGTIPLGDDKSIEVVNGKIAMHDYGMAYYEYVPEVKDDEGNVTKEASYTKVMVSEEKPWKAGLEPKVVTEDGKLVVGWFEPNPTTIEGVNDQVTAVQGTVTDLGISLGNASQGEPGEEGYIPATGLHADVEELVDIVGTSEDSLGENVDTLWAHVNDHETRIETLEGQVKALEEEEDADTQYHLEYDSNNKEIKLVVGKNDSKMVIDATPFIKDGMLADASYDAEKQELVFQWNTDAGISEDRVPVSGLVDVYTAGDGLKLENNEFSVVLDSTGESFLTLSASGLKLSGVQAAINEAKQAAIDAAATDASTKAATAKSEAIADAATKYYGKGETYTKDEIDELLEGIQGGASESAASVNAKLESYKKIVNAEVWGDEAGAGVDGNSRIDILDSKVKALEDVGSQANVIESVVGATGNRLNITTSGKTVTIDDANLRTDIAAAKKAGEDAGAAALEAANNAANAANVADGKAVKNAEDIVALQQADTTLGGKITALETTVNNETSGVAANYAAITKNASDIALLNAKDKTHDSDIADLKTSTGNNATAITNLQTAVSNVYTKAEADGKFVEKETGKSLIADTEIARLAGVNNYDDTAVKALIKGNTDAITDITKADGAIATAVAAEAAIARAAEKKNADDIAAINTLLNTVDSEDSITSLKELAIWVEEHGGEASEMAKSIKANTDAIELINDAEKGILVQAKAHSDANLVTAKAYADAEIAKIHGVDNKTIKLAENKAYVAEVSTDVLAQGEQELVLCAGDANGYHTTH